MITPSEGLYSLRADNTDASQEHEVVLPNSAPLVIYPDRNARSIVHAAVKSALGVSWEVETDPSGLWPHTSELSTLCHRKKDPTPPIAW